MGKQQNSSSHTVKRPQIKLFSFSKQSLDYQENQTSNPIWEKYQKYSSEFLQVHSKEARMLGEMEYKLIGIH